MGAGKRILSFGGGGAVGFLIGAGIARLTAAQDADALRAAIRAKVELVRSAGDAAQAAAEQRLIARFRGDVEDPAALEPEARQAALRQARASAPPRLGDGDVGAVKRVGAASLDHAHPGKPSA